MKPKHVKILAAVIAGLLAVLLILPFVLDVVFYSRGANASAATTISGLNDKLSSLEKEKKEIKEELDRLKQQKSDTQARKAALDRQISVTRQEITTINTLITELDTQINQFEAELAETERKEKEQYEKYKLRVRVMEEEGNASYISVLLAANSFSDLLTRVEIIRDVMNHDQKLMDQLQETRVQIEEKKAAIEDSRAQQAAAKEKLTDRQSSLQKQSAEAGQLVQSLSSQEEEYKKAYNEAESAMSSTKSELKKLLDAQKSGSTTYVGGTFLWPTPGYTSITSPYGMRFDPIFKTQKKHTGIDIGAPRGAKIVAANSGTVITAGFSSRGYGNYVVINHGGGKSTLYAHMSKILVSKGDKVNKGDQIGLVGSTGYSTGPHLHFEILINGNDTNPMNYFKKG